MHVEILEKIGEYSVWANQMVSGMKEGAGGRVDRLGYIALEYLSFLLVHNRSEGFERLVLERLELVKYALLTYIHTLFN